MAEILDGELHTSPRPAGRYSVAASGLSGQIWSPFDRVRKLPVYPREGVRHVWLVNPTARTLEVLRLEGGRWVVAAAHGGDDPVRAEPFDAIEPDLGALWGERPPARP